MRFNTEYPLVVVRAEIYGLLRKVVARLAVDTGATDTVISRRLLKHAGYRPELGEPRIIATGGGLVDATAVVIRRLRTLQHSQMAFPVVAHDLAIDSRIDGLLGLDFLRSFELTINFPMGRINLSAP